MIFNMLVGATKIPINVVPSTNSSFTYDGKSKTPVWQNYDAEQLTISGTTSATNAGTYTVYFTPKEEYEWSDGTSTPKEVKWSIAKAAGSLSLSATSGTIIGKYDATKTFTVTRSGTGTITVSSSNTSIATVSVSGTTVTVTSKGYGTATITVKVAADSNYNAPSNKTYSVKVDYLYLYNAGDQNTSVTGGWQAYASSLPGTTPAKPVITDQGTSVKVKMSASHSEGPYGGAYVTINKVSLNGFSTLKFTGTTTGNNNVHCMIRIWSNLVSNVESNVAASYYFPNYGISNSTVSLNVGSLNGSYTIGVYIYNSHSITMDKMWVE